MSKMLSVYQILTPIVIIFVVIKVFLNIDKKMYKNTSCIDIMTALRNRNAFENFLLELSKKKFPQRVGIAVMDLNNLKITNDTYGHMAGDKLIISVAEVLKQIKDIKTNLFRIGGDEFVCVIYGDIQSFSLPKRITEEINKYNKTATFKISLAVGYSESLVSRNKTHKQLVELFKNAYKKMYKNKWSMHEEMAYKCSL